MIGELLAKGADANHVEGGRNLLIWAAQSGLVEVAEALLAAARISTQWTTSGRRR